MKYVEGGSDGEIERETNCLPSIHALTRDQTRNISVYWMMLQLTEPPGQG